MTSPSPDLRTIHHSTIFVTYHNFNQTREGGNLRISSALDLRTMSAAPMSDDRQDTDLSSSEGTPKPQTKRTKPQGDVDEKRFQFCRECSNLLYPKEDRVEKTLMYACRTCQYSQPAASPCVFRHDLSNTVGETAGVTQDVGADPTLPRTNRPCPKCPENLAVFFQSQQRSAETGMKLFFVCCNCGTIFE